MNIAIRKLAIFVVVPLLVAACGNNKDEGNESTIDKPLVSNGGCLPGKFTVDAEGTIVSFSQGNLQYQASTNTWRFAEHQYDYIGDAAGNTSPSSTQTAWIDLFGWGTSGWNSGATAYQPWSTSDGYYDYYPGGNENNDLTGVYSRADWGVNNAITNGGNQAGMWRTLTADEWEYLFNTRAGSTINGIHNARYIKAQVVGVNGIILFPNNFTLPAGIISPIYINTANAAHTENTYNASQWALMETAGCVFLPAAGNRLGTTVYLAGFDGNYWSATHNGSGGSYSLHFLAGRVNPQYVNYRSSGFSVRLVKEF